VEQVDHVTCTDLRQRQIAELGQHVVLEPALVVLPVEATLPTLGIQPATNPRTVIPRAGACFTVRSEAVTRATTSSCVACASTSWPTL
jgi:hypothetical protein